MRYTRLPDDAEKFSKTKRTECLLWQSCGANEKIVFVTAAMGQVNSRAPYESDDVTYPVQDRLNWRSSRRGEIPGYSLCFVPLDRATLVSSAEHRSPGKQGDVAAKSDRVSSYIYIVS